MQATRIPEFRRRLFRLISSLLSGIAVAVFISTLSLPLKVHAASLKEKYELQELCGKQAETNYRGFVLALSMQNKNATATYTDHYNQKLNKCFVFLTAYGGPKKLNSMSLELDEVNENKTYGYFQSYENAPDHSEVIDCWVLNASGGQQKCHSRNEWDSLIRPYMEQ